MSGDKKPPDRNHPDYVEFTRHTFQENIMLCDAKSGILMGFGTVFLVWCFDRLTGENATGAETILYACATIALTVTIGLTWITIRPRIAQADDYIYWGSKIFRQPEADFLTVIQDADHDVLGRDMLRQLHVLAAICRNKYVNFRRAVMAAEISAALILLALCVRLVAHVWAA